MFIAAGYFVFCVVERFKYKIIIYYNMTQLLKVKVRKVGTSLGVLIPGETIREAQIEEGDEIELAMITHAKDLSGYGIAKNSALFVREKKTRYF